MHPREQTIFALSSGRPPSAISIVRVSGPQAGAALTSLAGQIPMPRRAKRALLRDANRQPIDDAVVLWFPGPASATGEDLAEFHLHGGRAGPRTSRGHGHPRPARMTHSRALAPLTMCSALVYTT